MPLFTSSKEKKYWLWTAAVIFAIFAILFVGQPLAKLFTNQDVQAIIFVLGMILVGATILIHALRSPSKKIEIALLLGIAAVYLMFFLRLGLPERSHLMEYSVLAIFIHKAFGERWNRDKKKSIIALIAILVSFIIGVIDECIQIVLPDRVFDPEDILFNGMAIVMAIGSNMLIGWVRSIRSSS